MHLSPPNDRAFVEPISSKKIVIDSSAANSCLRARVLRTDSFHIQFKSVARTTLLHTFILYSLIKTLAKIYNVAD